MRYVSSIYSPNPHQQKNTIKDRKTTIIIHTNKEHKYRKQQHNKNKRTQAINITPIENTNQEHIST